VYDGAKATCNNISVRSWWSVLLGEETGGPGEKIFIMIAIYLVIDAIIIVSL
jgi:hypothetical protein